MNRDIFCDYYVQSPHLKKLKRIGRAELLTANGTAEVVVQNASAYQRMAEELEELSASTKKPI